MRAMGVGLPLVALGCLLFRSADVSAQQVTVAAPHHAVGESFFEYIGTSWGVGGKGWFFTFGGPNFGGPQFGGFDPGAGAHFGFGFRRGGFNGFFFGNFAQGYRQSFVSRTPMVTLHNGVPGYVADASVSPFVISYVPVVGGFPAVGFVHPAALAPAYVVGGQNAGHPAVLQALQHARHNGNRLETDGLPHRPPHRAGAARIKRPDPLKPAKGDHADLVLTGASLTSTRPETGEPDEPARKLAAARSSSAGRPAASVAKAGRMYAAEQARKENQALALFERGRDAEASSKPSVARIYYQQAARRAPGRLRRQILARLEALEAASAEAP